MKPDSGALAHWLQHLQEPLPRLLLQIVAVVIAAKLMGRVAQRFGQPPVIGEMLAGIFLGPSLFGLLLPETQAWLFPPASLGSLKLLSLIGVIVFLFGVGAELDLARLRQQRAQALLVSHASILLPFLLGVLSALALYRPYAPTGVGFASFALFMGIAMSITAFPVLARILRERGLMGTPLGETAIACAAIDDVTAWCLLALVIALGQAQGAGTALPTLVATVLFIAALVGLLRPRLARLRDGEASGRIVALLLFALGCAWVTEVIGVHALFGAFLAGVAVSGQRQLRELVTERIEPFAGAILLPLFFAFTGLRTQIGLLEGADWLMCTGVIAVATLGKLGGATLASRASGQGWRDALALGALMNTRGLMELVVLNIGYDLGFLSDRIFAIMVLMALATTMMTGPLLTLLKRGSAAARLQAPA
ncbi:cation:proton antiporter domain-containing protein [Solimonas sp. K1W22B-7]|uniref:cation:proton antiporter domain-containing protein n=1 Tax=Solimonas sp. K1W22B-7 TaxID=2303331 RepID=UPI0013C3F345|nr:cation:proton antiporter [Solimonas sp. K1W22B-7]